jgi:hypothetical protein
MSESKPTKKEEREARKQLREAERLQKKLALQAAIEAAAPLLKPHPELGQWGIVKTRCWTFMHDKLRRQVKLKKPNKDRIEKLAWQINRVPTLTADECNALVINMKVPT